VSGLGEFAAAIREVADHCEASLALDACDEAAKDAVAILRIVTPKRTGALADSEIVNSVVGGGTHATANYGPHKIYDKFRNDGGTISAHYGEVWKVPRGGTKPRMYRHTLYFDGTFALHVTQAGSHYMQRGEAAAKPAVAAACALVLDRYLTL
jgi:hypothetical protein